MKPGAWGRQWEPLDAYVVPRKALQQPDTSLDFICEGLVDPFFLFLKLFESGHDSRASVQRSPAWGEENLGTRTSKLRP